MPNLLQNLAIYGDQAKAVAERYTDITNILRPGRVPMSAAQGPVTELAPRIVRVPRESRRRGSTMPSMLWIVGGAAVLIVIVIAMRR